MNSEALDKQVTLRTGVYKFEDKLRALCVPSMVLSLCRSVSICY